MEIPDNWTFKKQEIATNFDSHVREQLPWYDTASLVINHLVTAYAYPGARIYDLGCSTGNIDLSCIDVLKARQCEFIPIDNSPQMVSSYKGYFKPKLGDIVTYPYETFDIAICFLSLMFLTPDDREFLLDRLRIARKKHGIIIIVDKFLPTGTDHYLNQTFYKLALRFKLAQGASSEDIVRKELSLSGVQYPMDVNELDVFKEYQQVFQMGDFRGVVAR